MTQTAIDCAHDFLAQPAVYRIGYVTAVYTITYEVVDRGVTTLRIAKLHVNLSARNHKGAVPVDHGGSCASAASAPMRVGNNLLINVIPMVCPPFP